MLITQKTNFYPYKIFIKHKQDFLSYIKYICISQTNKKMYKYNLMKYTTK